MRRPWTTRPLRPLTRLDAVLYVLGGVLVPIACFSIGFGPDDRSGRWRSFVLLFFQHEVSWGFGALMLAAAAALCLALYDPKRYGASRAVRVLVAGGVLVSVTYIVLGVLSVHGELVLIVDLVGLGLWGVSVGVRGFAGFLLVLALAAAATFGTGEPLLLILSPLLGGPLWSLLAYGSMWRRLSREPLPEGKRLVGPFFLWFVAYEAALAHALIEASRLYKQLPLRPECYVATAAARGHPRFVRSWPAGQGRANAQLIWLKGAELALGHVAPGLHRLARCAYDRVGPPLAACLSHPLAADLAYLSLKPAEWIVRAAFAVALGAPARRLPRFPPSRYPHGPACAG